MSTIQQELVIKARADVANAKQGLASLDQSVDGLASAQEGLQTASNDAAQGLAAEAAAATSAAQATAAAATASNDAAAAAKKLGDNAKGATSGIDEATNESKKLTKQLKDVGDEIDVAAGKMINGIGGPGAIKAIGFAGIALAGVQQVADQFMKSSEALFKTWGSEGEAAFSLATKKSNDMAGAFAGAILGTDDMYLAAGRLATIFEALNVAAQLAAEGIKKLITYTPGGQLLKYLFDVTGATEGYSEMADSAAEKIKRQVQAQKDAGTSAAALAKPLGTSREQYESIAETVARLTGKVVDKDKVERASTIARLKDLQDLAKAEEAAAHLKAIQDNAELKRAEFTAAATIELRARAKKETEEYISKMNSDDRTMLSVSDKRDMFEKKLGELITTARPQMIQAQIDNYRRSATALMAEMNSPLELGTQLYIEKLQYQINDIETEGVKLSAKAGENTGASFVAGIVKGLSKKALEQSAKDTETMLKPIFDKLKEWANSDTIMINWMLARPESGYLEKIKLSAANPEMTEAERRAKRDAELPDYLDKAEGGPAKRAAEAKASADAAKAATDAAAARKAESDKQIQNIQETSGAVLDLAGAFASLGGVQDGVIDKMRQVVDVVIKIIQATQALEAVQAAQAAAKAAQDTAAAVAAGSTAVATAGVGAAASGAAASAGSAVVPILGAVAAVVGLMGSLFGGGSEAPRRDRGGGSGRTIYTSAGEAQGAGGDFAYFEGGRQNVTIVTNDAASIRTMQGRLAFVGSRGGSGF